MKLTARIILVIAALLFPSVPVLKMSTVHTLKGLTERDIKLEYAREQQDKRLEKATKAAEHVYHINGCSTQFSRLTAVIARETGLSPRILAAVVVSESAAHADAVYRTDVGLMQINTHWWKYSRAQLRDPEANMRIGARILKHYINRYGLVEGLHAYNGFGNPTNEYAQAVLARAGIKG